MTHLPGQGMMENDIRRLPVLVEAAGFTNVRTGRTSHKLLSYVRGRAEKG